MSAAEIRAATPDDAASLAPLYAAFFTEDAVPVPPDLTANLAAMLADPDAMVAILGPSATPLGLVSASLTRGAEFGLSAEIEDLYVVPEARGQGHARRLLEHAISWCEGRGARVLSLVITPEAEADQGLSALYTRFGFRDSGRLLMIRA